MEGRRSTLEGINMVESQIILNQETSSQGYRTGVARRDNTNIPAYTNANYNNFRSHNSYRVQNNSDSITTEFIRNIQELKHHRTNLAKHSSINSQTYQNSSGSGGRYTHNTRNIAPDMAYQLGHGLIQNKVQRHHRDYREGLERAHRLLNNLQTVGNGLSPEIIPNNQARNLSKTQPFVTPSYGFILTPSETAILNDFNRKGENNSYNIFQEQEVIRQKLPRCNFCSSNIVSNVKMFVCVENQCPRKGQLLCESCDIRRKVIIVGSSQNCEPFHKGHKIESVLSIMYFFQKTTNDLDSRQQQERIEELLKNIQMSIRELEKEISKLHDIKESLITLVVNGSSKDSMQYALKFPVISRSFESLLSNINEYDSQHFCDSVAGLVRKIDINSINKNPFTQCPVLNKTLSPNLNQLLDKFPAPFFPQLQHLEKQILVEPFAVLKNCFFGQQLTLNSTLPIKVKQLGALNIVCDGEMKLLVGRLKEAHVSFKGRRMDREIRSVIESLYQWGNKKAKLKKFSFEFDYKSNAHPTTENSSLLTDLLKVQSQNTSIRLLNAKNNVTTQNQIKQTLCSVRPARELELVVTLTPIHSHVPIVLEEPQRLLQMFQALGTKIVKLRVKLPIIVSSQMLTKAFRCLLTKPKLLEVDIQLGQSLTGAAEQMYKMVKKLCLQKKICMLVLAQYGQKLTSWKQGAEEVLELAVRADI